MRRSYSTRILDCFKREDYVTSRRSLDVSNTLKQDDDLEREHFAKAKSVARSKGHKISIYGRIEQNMDNHN